MNKPGDLILDESQIRQKLNRIAYQIFENNIKEKELVIAGIQGQGYILSEVMSKILKGISSLKIHSVKVSIDKKSPSVEGVGLDCEPKLLNNRSVILVDDVLNTGRTMAYSLVPFLNAKVKNLEVAVLVNRDHNQFPVRATYTGYELSTTIQNHIEVQIDNAMGVYLS